MIEKPVTDFPDPDSPTSPRIWPRLTLNDTSFTAFTTPARVKKCVWRLRTSRVAVISAAAD